MSLLSDFYLPAALFVLTPWQAKREIRIRSNVDVGIPLAFGISSGDLAGDSHVQVVQLDPKQRSVQLKPRGETVLSLVAHPCTEVAAGQHSVLEVVCMHRDPPSWSVKIPIIVQVLRPSFIVCPVQTPEDIQLAYAQGTGPGPISGRYCS